MATTTKPQTKKAAPVAKKTAKPAPKAKSQFVQTAAIEHIKGTVLDGKIDVSVRRRDLTNVPESKVALMKRLLMTPGETKESILKQVAKHPDSSDKDAATLNTTRADLQRAINSHVIATGWKTDGKKFTAPTAAIARMRTHSIGAAALSVEVKPVEKAEPKPEAKPAAK